LSFADFAEKRFIGCIFEAREDCLQKRHAASSPL
jgi:hypothetical protein